MKFTRTDRNAAFITLAEWTGIIKGRTPLADTLSRCDLCVHYGHCAKCPLDDMGNGCLREFSTWNTIRRIILAHAEIDWTETCLNWELAERDIDLFHELFVLCNRMRHHIIAVTKLDLCHDV